MLGREVDGRIRRDIRCIVPVAAECFLCGCVWYDHRRLGAVKLHLREFFKHEVYLAATCGGVCFLASSAAFLASFCRSSSAFFSASFCASAVCCRVETAPSC